MQPIHRSPSHQTLPGCLLAAGLLAFLVFTGCSEVDPLDAIRKQMTAGDYAAAIEPLRELLTTRPDDPEVNFLYGQALSATQPNLAVWSLRKAMEDPEWLVPAGSQLAYLALVGLDFNEVEKITGRILERDPENTRVLMMRANGRAHSKRDPERAIADARRILEIDPDASEAYEPLILGLLGLGRFEEASAELAKVGELIKKIGIDEGILAWHCSTTAAFEQESGDLEGARKTWLKCLEAYPTDVDVVTSSMKFYDAQGEPDRSLEVVRAAFAIEPDSTFFRTTLAQRIHATGDATGAEAVLLEATENKNPELAADAWMDLGKFRQALGDYTGAADALEKTVALLRETDSATPQVLFEYADALIMADRLELALEVAEDLTVPAHRHLIVGRVAQERREPARALEEFGEALRLWPDNPWARYSAALAAEELGDFERALAEFRDAVRIDPSATDARTRGASQLVADGNPGAALVMLQTAIGEAPLEIEGQLLGMRLSGLMGNTTGVADFYAMIEQRHPARTGQGLAEAAEGLAQHSGPALAVSMLKGAPRVDFNQPRFAPALRALVRFSYAADQSAEARAALQKTRASLQKILDAHPDASAFQEIRAFDLELSGAPADAVQAAYARALELGPQNAQALAGLGRLATDTDPDAALGYFDLAAAADPSDPDLKLAAARALIASGKIAEAEKRLDALLLEHPLEAAAAADRAELDLRQGIATPQTLERARRAARFGGGPDALELLSKVLTERKEPELAARAAKEAETQRAAAAAGS